MYRTPRHRATRPRRRQCRPCRSRLPSWSRRRRCDLGRVLRPPRSGRARRRPLARRRRRAGGALPRRRAGEAGRPADHHRPGALRGRGRSRRRRRWWPPQARAVPTPRASSSARQRLLDEHAIAQRELDERTNAQREADANLRAAKAALQSARLNLGYTQVRAPVAGPRRQARGHGRQPGRRRARRAGADDAGLGEPDLRELRRRRAGRRRARCSELARRRAARARRSSSIPVQMGTAASSDDADPRPPAADRQPGRREERHGARARRVRQRGRPPDPRPVRARCAWARRKAAPALLINERAVGTDQNKKFVMVVGADNKAAYREVTLGAHVDGLRIVTSGPEGRRARRRQRPAARAPRRAGGAAGGADGRAAASQAHGATPRPCCADANPEPARRGTP